MVVLVAGGTGNVGAGAVRALSEAGVAARVLTRDPSSQKANALASLPGITLVKGDASDSAALASALEGADACMICLSNSEDQVSQEKAFVDAAASCSSCAYLVKVGTCGAPGYTAKDSKLQYARYHAEVEAHLAVSSLQWTVLRPNWFMQNHMGDIFGTLPQGIIAYPLRPGSKARMVDTRDVGAVAAKLLALPAADREKHSGKIYDVCGPSSVSTSLLAKMYRTELGRPIQPVKTTAEEWIAGAEKAGFPAWLAKAVSYNFTDYWDKGGLDYDSSPEVLELCPPARTMRQWIQEHSPMSPPPPLKKPEFVKVGKIEPEQSGVNLKVKVVKAAESSAAAPEVLLADDSGAVVFSATAAQVEVCREGASLRIQNARCKMVKGYIRLLVDKWGVVKPLEEALAFEANKNNNVSSVEYELA